ncbi:MAG: Rieske 2Fe-2S domain-containing protein [Rhodospirillum sp.]|nr:Rieske 2Fe-2S domain-containing protein [Rhodospirillum sp.]MCF8487670.1 Rieske 2Fe-2S domain-containing protein [Rhodospirillum sp.]MCF8500415.1 Rieske 2Fe-2S domain-containing protein [Rhodospirillum sp.]
MKVFVVRHDSGVRGYVNRCPHNRIPLDFKPDDFLNLGKTHIQCATHGALFLMGDGLCVEGPCRGKRLDAFPVTVLNGRIQCGDPRQTRVGQGDRHSPLDPPGKGTKTLNRSREK